MENKQDNNKRTIDIGGVKMEVDPRYAKTIENYKVGDRVKLLIKEYSSYKVNRGVIYRT